MEIYKIQLHFQDIYIKDMIEDGLQQHSTMAQLKNLSYYMVYDDNIPKVIRSDPNKINQILRNLLFNALKYTDSGQVIIKVELHNTSDVRVIISDTGCGFSQFDLYQINQDIQKIYMQNKYHKFFVPKGNSLIGLGLMISAILIKGVSGDRQMEIKSKPTGGTDVSFVIKNWDADINGIKIGRYKKLDKIILRCSEGTESVQSSTALNQQIFRKLTPRPTFNVQKAQNSSIIVPQIMSDDQTLQAEQKKTFFEYLEEGNNQRRKFSQTPKLFGDELLPSLTSTCYCNKILIVDDDDFNRMALQTMLKRFSLSADEAKNGLIAVEKVLLRFSKCQICKTYKLIIMDVDMPQLNGYEATHQITQFIKSQPNVPLPDICIHTAYLNQSDYQKQNLLGFKSFLQKPISPNEFYQLITKTFNVQDIA